MKVIQNREENASSNPVFVLVPEEDGAKEHDPESSNLLSIQFEKISKQTTLAKGSDSAKVAKDTLFFGLRSLMIAVGFMGIGEVMSVIGEAEAAASSVAITFQGLIVGAGAGFVMGIGAEISAAQGRGESREVIFKIARVGFLESTVLGTIGGALCLSTRFWLPLILQDANTATAAVEYLTAFAGAPMTEFLILYFGQLVFRIEKNSLFGLVNSSIYRLTIIPLAYCFGITLEMGATGVGLASTVGGVINVLPTIPWFSRKEYVGIADLSHGVRGIIVEIRELLYNLIKSGGLLSLQRISEWGNLFIITEIIGNWSNDALLAIQPTLLGLTLTGQLVNGFSLAGMLIVIERAKALQKYIKTINSNDENFILQREQGNNMLMGVRNSFLVANLTGLIVNGVLAVTLYLSSNSLINFLLPNDVPQTLKDLSRRYLLINLAFTFPDTIRVISGNPLLAWNDLPFSVLSSLISMSVIGIPLGVGIAYFFNKNPEPIFFVRGGAIFCAAIGNVCRAISHMRKNHREIEQISTEKGDGPITSSETAKVRSSCIASCNFTFFSTDGEELPLVERTETRSDSYEQGLDEVENRASCCVIL